MKKIAKIALMLAVYLVWVCSNSVIALSCYANHDKHIHCCGQSCDCHHEDCEKIHFESPHGCHHDHSNRIALYDTTKENNIEIEPVALSIAAQLEDKISIEEIVLVRSARHYLRKVPLPTSPTLSRRGMRAPPVVA